MKQIIVLAIILAQQIVAPVDLYKIEAIGQGKAEGYISVSARKEYNIWDYGPNRTYYDVSLHSPKIQYKFQEIRIALEWANAAGTHNERVVFYATVGDEHFLQYRIDENYDSHGRFSVPNFQVASIPKYNTYLTEELTSQDEMRYHIKVTPNRSQILINEDIANLTFSVERDEPYGDNLLWVNWGVFNSPDDVTLERVYGQADPYPYTVSMAWSDYFDRPFITYLYMIIAGSSLLFVLSPTICILPIVILEIYVFGVPLGISAFVLELSDGMTAWSYFLEVMLRWQAVVVATSVVMAFFNFLPTAMLFYMIRETQNDFSTFQLDSNVIIEQAVQLLYLYPVQLLANIAIGIVMAFTLPL